MLLGYSARDFKQDDVSGINSARYSVYVIHTHTHSMRHEMQPGRHGLEDPLKKYRETALTCIKHELDFPSGLFLFN